MSTKYNYKHKRSSTTNNQFKSIGESINSINTKKAKLSNDFFNNSQLGSKLNILKEELEVNNDFNKLYNKNKFTFANINSDNELNKTLKENDDSYNYNANIIKDIFRMSQQETTNNIHPDQHKSFINDDELNDLIQNNKVKSEIITSYDTQSNLKNSTSNVISIKEDTNYNQTEQNILIKNNDHSRSTSKISSNKKDSKNEVELQNSFQDLTKNILFRMKTKNINYSLDKNNNSNRNEIKLTPREKFRRLYLKITIVLLFNYIWNRIKFYGLNILKADIEEELQRFVQNKININTNEFQPSSYSLFFKNIYIHPDSFFLNIWNFIRIIIYLYSITYMVYIICILDRIEIFTISWFIDYFIEILFLIDIFLYFISGYYKNNELVLSNKRIIKNYISSYLLFDIIGIIPFELFIKQNKDDFSIKPSYAYHRLVRIFTMSRIYDSIQHYDRLNFIKKLKKFKPVDKILKKIRMNAGITRLINTIIFVLLLSHIFACMWFYSAKLGGLNEESWVVRFGLENYDSNSLYLTSLYYSLTVVTTVGFGDIYSNTNFERILTCLWMVIGVSFYSYVISNLSSIITSLDFHSSLIQRKIDKLNEFAQKLNLSDDVYLKIKKVYEENDNQYFIQDDELLEDLPYNIKVEILFHIHHEKIISNFYFLNRNINLVVELISKWKNLIFSSFEYVYIEGETPYDSKLNINI